MKLTFVYGLIFLGIVMILYWVRSDVTEGMTDFKSDSAYKNQIRLLSERFKEVVGTSADKNVSNPTAKRPVTGLITSSKVPAAEQCFVNFYALGTRFTGYVGPMQNGYFDPDTAVQLAVNAGCRVFVLEIDYLDDCKDTNSYFPQLVVRDIQGKMLINITSNQPFCNTAQSSNIREVCDKINFYAFSSSAQNANDPVVLVLYFLRQPPGSYKSKTVLDYYSNVAKALEPLKKRMITNEIFGGSFYRQKQQDRLLINKITDYNGRVLVFSNANTNGFREVKYPTNEDLDYSINLRLSYTQTKLGVTENNSGSIFGILQTTDDYRTIPADRSDETIDQTKLRWTICLSKDPTKPVTKDVYDAITKTYGVNCVPIQLFDSNNSFMFAKNMFQTYSYLLKPKPLRYNKPGIAVPGEANPSMNANQGKLRAPTI